MTTFILNFSHIVEGVRIPLMDGDKEATMIVEADSKLSTYSLPSVIKFCESVGETCRVRRVM